MNRSTAVCSLGGSKESGREIKIRLESKEMGLGSRAGPTVGIYSGLPMKAYRAIILARAVSTTAT